MKKPFFFKRALGGLLLMCVTTWSAAQAYPIRPVRVVVPFPAGTATDLSARVIANHLQTALGQPFVVDNKPGAGGSIGAMEVVRAVPDGYTILIASNSALSSNVALLKSIPYDPAKDLTPVAGVSQTTLVLMVKPGFPANNLQEFIAYVKSRPGKLSAGYGSSSSQIAIAILNKAAGLDVLAVPYKGIPLAVNDVIGGILDFAFVDLGNALAQTRGNAMKPLGVVTAQRNALVPDWPAIAEVLPNFDIPTWVAVAGPIGMAPRTVAILQSAVDASLKTAEVKNRLATAGFAPMPMDPSRLKTFMSNEIVNWKQMAADANIEPQ
jgi:tripartite-type tricarboxylate transporter receptor subunit TctC